VIDENQKTIILASNSFLHVSQSDCIKKFFQQPKMRFEAKLTTPVVLRMSCKNLHFSMILFEVAYQQWNKVGLVFGI